MATINDCVKDIGLLNIERASGNDLTTLFTARYRLLSDPDVDASYTLITEKRNMFGVEIPDFNPNTKPAGIYVLHIYQTSKGSDTGTKITMNLTCNNSLS